ncbi:MAG: cupin domain-containing protein [Tissierellia bacterium]|nr:cupin domain-containing protein [Tissierellia bacterium]
MKIAEEIIQKLNLQPLAREGGLFRSTYRSVGKCDGKDMGSAIYFMLVGNAFSHLHRLPTDEVYHFYGGDPVMFTELLPDGTVKQTTFGSDILAGEQVQYVAKAGNWQGSRLKEGGTYALMGTTMSPGFDEEDYEHATDPEMLKESYPQMSEEIDRLTGEAKFR